MRSTASSQLVSRMLLEYGALTRSVLYQYLPSWEPQRHYELVAAYPKRCGWMLGSSLCLATASAFGSRPEPVLGAAVSIELARDAYLVHQDISDDVRVRRGSPALHLLSGVPLAINAGVALTLMSLRPIIEAQEILGRRLGLQVLEEFNRMAMESVEGQALELGWRRDGILEFGLDDYLKMVLKRDCWLNTIHPCRTGALIATEGRVDLDSLLRFGFFLGAALKIRGEVMGLLGDETGSSLGGGQRTLPLLLLFHRVTEDERARLREIYDRPRAERSPEQVCWIRRRMEAYGTIDHARHIACGFAGSALREHAELFGLLPESGGQHFLRALSTTILEENGEPI